MKTAITQAPLPTPAMTQALFRPHGAWLQDEKTQRLEDKLSADDVLRPEAKGWECVTPLPFCHLTAAFKKKLGLKRDFKLFPTIIDIPQAPKDLWAISDIHGDCDRFVKLASSHGLVKADGVNIAHWTGGDATLVILGDMIDKGPKNYETFLMIRHLQVEAPQSGGRVIALIGNHEVQFLADPYNDKAMGPGGIYYDLRELIPEVPYKKFATDETEMGFWFRRLPFGARVGDWFFAHGGQTSGRNLIGLGKMLEVALKSNGFKDTLIGGPNSLVRARNWWGGDNAAKGLENARLLGVGKMGHGHDPDTIYPRGKIVNFPKQDPRLFRLDTGLTSSINYSHGEMLHVRYTEKGDLCEACGQNGKTRPLGLLPRHRESNSSPLFA